MMTLDQLIILVTSKYTGSPGMRRAKEEVTDLEKRTQKLNKALNLLTGVMGAGAIAGLSAFANWDRTMTTLAGKAGVTRREFNRLFADSSSAISRATGASRALIAEGQQRAFSLGGSAEEIDRVVRLGAILQAGNQAALTTAVESAFRISAQGFGDADRVLQRIYQASQIGAGDVADYFQSAIGVSGISKLGGVDISEMLSAISVLSRTAKSLPEGETQYRSFIASINKPSSKVSDFIEERTGKTSADLQTMLAGEGGLANVIEFLSGNFDKDEFLKVTNERIAAEFLVNMADSLKTLRDNTATILGTRDPIGDQGREQEQSFANSIDRLWKTLTIFFTEYGEPLAIVMRRLLLILTGVLSTLITLNDMTGGLLAIIPSLITAILGLRLALLGGKWLAGLARDFLGDGRDGKDGKSDKKGGWFDSKSFGAGMGSAIAGAFAATGGMKLLGPITGIFTRLRMAIKLGFNDGIRPLRKLFTGKGTANPFAYMFHGGAALTPRGITMMVLRTLSFALLNPLSLLFLGTGGLAMYLARNTDSVKELREQLRKANARRDHFLGGGSVEDAPPPGEADVARAQTEKNMAAASIELQTLSKGFNDMLPDWYMKFWVKPINIGINYLVGKLVALGEFIWKIVTSPATAWEKTKEWISDVISTELAFYNRILGFQKEGNNQAIVDALKEEGDEGMRQFYLSLTEEDKKRLGIDGLPTDLTGQELVPIPNLPTPDPHPPLTPQQQTQGVVGGPHPYTFNSTPTINITLNGTEATPEQTKKAAKEALEEAAANIFYEVDAISP